MIWINHFGLASLWKEFNRVVIFQNGHRISDYTLEYSVDGIVWHVFAQDDHFREQNSNGISFLDYTHYERITGQFVKLRAGHTSPNIAGISIFEFEVYNMPNMYNVIVRGIDANTGEELAFGTQSHVAGRINSITAPVIPGYTVFGVLVDGERTTLVGSNRVNVNVRNFGTVYIRGGGPNTHFTDIPIWSRPASFQRGVIVG